MGFFENAYDFDIFGGKFYDIGGNQINLTDDKSMRIGGGGNRTQMLPNLSHQDSRTYSMSRRSSICSSAQTRYPDQQEEQFIDDREPVYPQSSTCSYQLIEIMTTGSLLRCSSSYYIWGVATSSSRRPISHRSSTLL